MQHLKKNPSWSYFDEQHLTEQQPIFVITPTHERLTQKVDLTTLCLMLMNVANLTWIVIEDADSKTKMVTDLLEVNKMHTVIYF